MKIKKIINLGLLAIGAPVIITGLLKLDMPRILRDLHDVTGILFVSLVLIHVALNARWIKASVIKALKGTNTIKKQEMEL